MGSARPIEESRRWGSLLLIASLGGMALVSGWNFLAFHTLTELFVVAGAWTTFALAWASRHHLEEDGRFFLGCAYFFIGFLHLLHALCYKGMGVFTHVLAVDAATQLWVAARLFEATALIAFARSRGWRFPAWQTLPTLALLTALIVVTVLVTPCYPACFRPGIGLTGFKIFSEVLFVVLLAVAAITVHRNEVIAEDEPRGHFLDGILFGILAELAFCLYTDVYGFLNVLGHLLKIVSVFHFYRALVHFSITHPFTALFKGLFWTNRAVKLLIDPTSGAIVDANPAACEFYGYDRERMRALRITDLNVASAREVFADMARAVAQRCLFFSFRHRLASGEIRDVEVHSGPILYLGRRLLFSIVSDVTERKHVEARMHLLATAIEQAGEVVVITDDAGRILYANPAFERITGFAEAEVLGQTHAILRSGTHARSFYAALWARIRGGETWSGRMVNRRKDGSLYTEEAVISPVRSPEGRIEHYVAVKRDITRELDLELQLRQSRKMEAIGRLAGGVAHDFNNLLQTIAGTADLLLVHEEEDSTKRRDIEEILRATETGRRLVQQLLTVGRRRVHEPCPIDLGRMLEDGRTLFTRILGDGVRLVIESDRNVPPVLADRSLLEQVLMNLLVNGRDAMPDGGNLRLHLSTYSFAALRHRPAWAKQELYVRLSVEDEGTGIDPELLERIWEPFFSTKADRGTGLGLSTVYGIVTQHGGHVRADPRQGGGTRFTVYLPAAGATAEASPPKAPRVAASPPSGRKTVLVADDDPAILGIVSRFLVAEGLHVVTASNGREALERFEEAPDSFQLLLFDVVMPELDGREASSRILERRPALPLIFMSGYDRGAVHRDFVRNDEILFLSKPFRKTQLIDMVHRALGRTTSCPKGKA